MTFKSYHHTQQFVWARGLRDSPSLQDTKRVLGNTQVFFIIPKYTKT